MKIEAREVGGFSLVEVAVAVAIASFCLLILLALVPVGIKHSKDADAQTTMSNLSTTVADDLTAATNSTVIPPGTVSSPRFQFSVPPAGGTASASPQTIYVDASGATTGTVGSKATARSIYRVSVFFYPPSTSSLKTATLGRIWITFPAQADPTAAVPAVNYTDMYETTISLNRN